MKSALIVGLGLCLSLTAYADEEEEESSPPVVTEVAQPHQEEVSYTTTVVGGHDPNDAALVGASATTVTRERLEALPGGDTQPLTAFVSMQPGVVQDSFGSNLHFRANDGAVLYVIDGIPLISPSVGTVGQLLNTIPTRLVQSVNILSGGFPVEYSYSLGGVVDIKTREPTADPTGQVQLLYGTYDHLDVAANYAQKIGNLSLLASANFLSTSRGLDTPDAIIALNDDRVGGNAFLKARYDLTEQDRIELLGTFQQDKFHVPIDATMLPLSAAPRGAVRGNDVYGDGPPPFTPYNAHPTDLERSIFAALSYHHEGDVSTQVSLYARQIYEDFYCDPLRQLGPSADPGSSCSNFKRDALHFGVFSHVTGKWSPTHTWKAGIQIDDAPSKLKFSLLTRDDVSAAAGPDPTMTLAGSDNINSLTGGLYLQDRIELGDFTLLPGVRIDLQNTTFGGANLPNRFFAGPSVRLGASYVPTESVVIHGFVGYLWEAPTNFDAPLVAGIVDPTLAGQKLPVDMKAAKTWSGQLGVSYHPTSKITIGIDGWGRLMQDWLDHQNIGNTALWAAFNWDQGWAAGGDVFATGEIGRFFDNALIIDGFGNVSGQQAKQKGIDSLTYLFSADDLQGSQTWTVMDHVQFWTANAGLLLHDADNRTNLSVRFNYGNGFHVGVVNNNLVPEHATVDVTMSHTFDLPVPITVAFDAFNLFNDIYAYRLGTAFFGNSQYAPLRQFDVRLIGHFG